MAIMDERKIMELSDKSSISITDQIIIEDEDGTKRGYVSDFKKLMTVNLVYDTVADMKAASFKEGDRCFTLGYNSKGDGGSGLYDIRYEPTAHEDKGNVIYLKTSDTLRAFLNPTGFVTPEQFGAFGDGIRNDAAAINLALNTGYTVKFGKGKTYIIGASIILKEGMIIDMDGATLKPVNCDGFQLANDPVNDNFISNITIKNFTIDSSKGVYPIRIQHPVKNVFIDNFKIINMTPPSVNGIMISTAQNMVISNGIIENTGKDSTLHAVGINIMASASSRPEIKSSDITINNVAFNYMDKGLLHNHAAVNYSVTMNNCAITGFDHTTDSYLGQSTAANLNITMRNCLTTSIKSVFRNSAKAKICIDGLEAYNIGSLLYVLDSSSNIVLHGNINITGENLVTKTPLLEKMAGTLMNAAYIDYNADRHIPKSNITADTIGVIMDPKDPRVYNMITQTSSNGTLAINEFNNSLIDFKGSNLTTITQGMKGMLIYVTSSSGNSITNSASIKLKNGTSVVLKNNSGVLLKNISGVWYEM